jgi:hypothetical protein
MSSGSAFAVLWVTVGINFAVGLFIWFAQREELDSWSPDPEAYAWSAIGTNLMGFAILVAVVTLAAHAIVGAIKENANSK